ncbi:MAG: hypothetical protein ACM3O8_07870 [Methylococcaceae bacterium]
MKDLSSVFFISLLLILLNSCHLEELQFDKLAKQVDTHPTFIAPIAKGNVTVWDFVNAANKENDNITKDPNGLIKIVYKQDNIFTYNISELLEFPTTNNFSSGEQPIGDISPEDVNISRSINLQELSGKVNGQLDGVVLLNGKTAPFPSVKSSNLDAAFVLDNVLDFKTITLSKGTLKVELKNKLKVPLSLTGSLYDVLNNKPIDDFAFSNVAPGTTSSLSFDLKGSDLSNDIEFRLYSFETLGSATPVDINLNDYFTLAFGMSDLSISKGVIKIVKPQSFEGAKGNFEFDFPESNLKAFGAMLKKGTLSMKSVNSLPLSGVIHFTIPEIKNQLTGAPITADVPMDGSTQLISLDNTIINFSSDAEKPYNRIPYSYNVTINQTPGFINFSSTDAVKLEISLDGLDFQGMVGDFGKRSITIDPDKFALNVDMLDKLKGDFKLDNPVVTFTLHNSVGIPATISFNLTASNKEGKIVSMNLPSVDIPVPAGINAGIATKNVSFTRQNSNIVDFISLPPTGDITYSGKVDFNDKGVVTPENFNFLDMNAVFGVDMSLELPLELQVSNLTFRDTSAISGEDFKNIETADLILNTKNGVPLDIDLQLLFIDTITGHQFGATNVTRMLSTAQVSPQGTITPVESSHTFSLDKTQMEQLKKANAIVFSGILSSPNGGTGVAAIYSDSRIEMNIVVKSKVNLNF